MEQLNICVDFPSDSQEKSREEGDQKGIISKAFNPWCSHLYTSYRRKTTAVCVAGDEFDVHVQNFVFKY